MRRTSIIALGALALVIASGIQVSRLSQTCVACRLTRVDSTCLGLTRSSYYPNACSQWYPDHVEPAHTHVWERGTCRYTSTLLGFPVSVGCNPGHYPIRLLDPSTQIKMYQHFKDPLEAKALFLSIADEKSHGDRLDEDDEDRGHLTVDAIRRWESEGFPGTWEDRWARFHADHVRERQEWRTWMNAKTDLNFGDWRKTRKKAD